MKFNLCHLGLTFSYSLRMIQDPQKVLSLEHGFSILTLLIFWIRQLYVVRDCPVHWRVFSSFLTLYPLDAKAPSKCLSGKSRMIPLLPLSSPFNWDNQNCLQALSSVPQKSNHPQLSTISLEQLGRGLVSILVFIAATLLPLSLKIPACHCLKACTSTSPFLSHEDLFQGSKLQCLLSRLFRYTGNDPSYCYCKPQGYYVHRAESFLGDAVLHCLGFQLFLHSELFYLLHFYSSSHLRNSCSMLL